MKRLCIVLAALVVFLTVSGTSILANPTYKPPAGQTWVESKGQWTLVAAPPDDGPYMWKDGKWVPDTNEPVGALWIPGHWTDKGWLPGHWRQMPIPPKKSWWVPGHRGPQGRWFSGRWD